jgi:hypothetical protein
MEFLLLLLVTLVVSAVVTVLVILFFRKPIDKMLLRVIGDEVAQSWRKFLMFALLVVGISSGVNPWRLERFIQPEGESGTVLALTAEQWGLEIYRSIIQSLGGMAWALLVFFVVVLIAFVIVRRGEQKAGASS